MQIVRKQYQQQRARMWDGEHFIFVPYSKKRHSPHKRLVQRLKHMNVRHGFEWEIRRKPKEKFILVEDKRWIA